MPMLRPFSGRTISLLLSPVLALVLALPSFAKDGRDFTGFYAVNNVTESEGNSGKSDRTATVDVTLTVQIFNNSDLGDIKAPVLALLESGPSHARLGEFGAVKVLPAKHDVIVSGNFTLSKEAFGSWSRRGVSPRVVVIYRDEEGRELRENVQLSRRPMLPPATTE
jgi:hypothetical protein